MSPAGINNTAIWSQDRGMGMGMGGGLRRGGEGGSSIMRAWSEK